MLKEKQALLRRILMISDIGIVCIAFFVTFMIRNNLYAFYRLDLFPDRQMFSDLSSLSKYLNLLPILLFAWWAALSSSGLYESFRVKNLYEIVWAIVRGSFFVMIVFATITFIFRLTFISRSFIIGSFIIATVFLIIERWSIVLFLRYLRKRGYNYRNILLVGTGSRAKRFIKMVHKHHEWGWRITGLIDAEKKRLGKTIYGEEVIGLLEDIPNLLQEKVIDEVIYIVPRKWLSIIEKSLLACETQGIKTRVAADFFNMKIARSTSSDIDGIPLLEFKTTLGEEWQLLLKRLFDIILSVLGIIMTLPIFVIITIIIKSFYPGPVIFKQVRSGLNGRTFVMYKFRTMINGAESEKDKLKNFNEIRGPAFKMTDDPRVTRFGRFLRRTSLDELPQLLNVFRGDMSLVGPRPPIPAEVAKYKIWQRRRLSMKPGLTCLWQANGRNNVDFDKWMEMDLKYIDNWSLGLDFKILLKTIPAVLFSVGAK